MLIKILNFEYKLGTNAELTVVLNKDDNSGITTETITSYTDATYFLLRNVSKDVDFTLTTVTPDNTTKQLVIAFDATVVASALVAGNVISIGAGTARIPVAPGATGLLNTASISYNVEGAGKDLATDIPTITTETLLAPNNTSTNTSLFNLLVNVVDLNGASLGLTEISLSEPFKVAGVTITEVILTKIYDTSNIYSAGDDIQFSVEYLNANKEPVVIQEGDFTSISAFTKRKYSV